MKMTGWKVSVHCSYNCEYNKMGWCQKNLIFIGDCGDCLDQMISHKESKRGLPR